jgi:hypothetical protein
MNTRESAYGAVIEEIQRELKSLDEKPTRSCPRPGKKVRKKLTPLMKKGRKKILCWNSNQPYIRCKKRFYPEVWQHTTMAWCPECQIRPEYRYFNSQVVVEARRKYEGDETEDEELG